MSVKRDSVKTGLCKQDYMVSAKRILFIILLAAIAPMAFPKSSAPKWLSDLKKLEIPASLLQGNPDVVVLRDELHIEVEPDGTFNSVVSQALLIRTPAGYEDAVARVGYSEDTDKIKSFEAWVIPAKGKRITYDRNDISDSVNMEYKEIASSYRIRSVSARGDVLPGSIFAFEAEVENDDVFSQEVWMFQGEHPALRSTVSVEYPDDWDLKTRFFNMERLEPIIADDRKFWSLKNVHGVERQVLGPSEEDIRKWMALEFVPPPGSKRRYYGSWEEISAELSPEYVEQFVVTEEMEAKVEELAGSATSTVEIAKSLALLAQSVNYVSVALNLGKGGGIKPRPADKVFKSNYGDCKDKTNLLCALLKVKGIEAFPLIVNSGYPVKRIHEEWPTSSQFNHCIAAVRVAGEVDSPAVIEHSELGKLFVFDPTDSYTSWGDLPSSLQGAKGLLLAGDSGGLVSLPEIPVEKSLMSRQVQVELLPSGDAVGVVTEHSTGQEATKERQLALAKDSDYEEMTEKWISHFLPNSVVQEPIRNDDREKDLFSLEVQFATPRYAKNMRGVLLIFKPIILNRSESTPFDEDSDGERTQPIVLSARNLKEESLVFMPKGFQVSELPESIRLEEDFGVYDVSYAVEGDQLKVNRVLRIKSMKLSAERISAVKDFYKTMVKTDQTPVVLERI